MRFSRFGRDDSITADAGEDTITDDMYNDPEFMELDGVEESTALIRQLVKWISLASLGIVIGLGVAKAQGY